MKVKIYPINFKIIEKSGIGRAIKQQKYALQSNGVEVVEGSDYDLIHVNTRSLSTIRLIREAKRKGKKVVVHAHSTEEDFRNSFMFSNALSPLFKKWLMMVYNKGDLILTPTPYSRELIKSYGIKPKILDISNGIDLSKFEASQEKAENFRKKYGFTKDDKIIMTVGLFLRRKGIFDFVELAKKMPDYQFVWCGYVNPNLLPKDTRQLLKTELDNLHFIGYVDDMVSAYSGADLFFMPSYEETEGIVVLEALSMKVPTLLRDIDVYKPWLKNGENCHMASNNDEFEKMIRQITGSERDVEMLEKGYQVAKERDIHKIGKKLKEIYTELLGE